VVGGIGLAFLLSPLTPVGEARLADPSTGFDFDAVVLLAGALAAVVVVVALGLLPAIVSTRDQHAGRMTKVARPSRVVALLAQAGAPPSALIGVRHSLERGRGRDAVPVGPALVGSVVAVSALCATAVFGASLTHLTGTPALYGEPFDLAFLTTAPYSPIQLGQLAAVFERNGAISAATVTRGEDVRIDGRSVDALAGQALQGQLLVTTTEGRLPRAEDEVALGPPTLGQVGAHVGSVGRFRCRTRQTRCRSRRAPRCPCRCRSTRGVPGCGQPSSHRPGHISAAKAVRSRYRSRSLGEGSGTHPRSPLACGAGGSRRGTSPSSAWTRAPP
jgi:hypothetical protein